MATNNLTFFLFIFEPPMRTLINRLQDIQTSHTLASLSSWSLFVKRVRFRLNALAEDGIFRVGGVLIGTIAYRCIANLLGVKFLSATAVTANVDIAWKSDTFRHAI